MQAKQRKVEAKCDLNLKTLKNGKIEREVITLKLPMLTDELNDLLEMHKSGIEAGNFYISETQWLGKHYTFDETMMRNDIDLKDIHNINFFTQRLSEMSDNQRKNCKA